jgi:hypothetical protein
MKSLLISLLVLLPAVVVRADCGRLEAGDSYQKINQILECLESQISDFRESETAGIPYQSGEAISAEKYTGGKEQEANNYITEANLIRIGQPVRGRLTDNKDRDYYKFTTPLLSANQDQQKFRVILRKEFSGIVDIYDDVENQIISALEMGDKSISKLVESKPDSYYYVLVKPYSNSNSLYGNYELVIREEE